MCLKAVTVESRLGVIPGQSDGEIAFFDDATDSGSGVPIRHYVLLQEGVKLMYEPWGWRDEWYADIVRVESVRPDRIRLVDLYVDVIVEAEGPAYRVIDLDDLANAAATGVMRPDEVATTLRQLQRFVDGHLHRGRDFPPQSIRPYMPNGASAR